MKIKLTDDQLDQLYHVYRKDSSHTARQRAHAIILLKEKEGNLDDVADILRVCRVTIYNWAKRWIKNGIEGLYDLEGRGRNPIFSESEEEQIVSLIEENPSSMNSTLAILLSGFVAGERPASAGQRAAARVGGRAAQAVSSGVNQNAKPKRPCLPCHRRL